ncbi:ATP-binding protein [Planomonospora algeriensis]
MDVVRAALSEVENYDRVVTRVQSEVAVAGPAVSDVVHLLAELVENALSFSPGETEVVVSSSRIDGGGVMVSVTDQGIGMTAEELAEVNRRLADPQPADASVARRMGLFVVGRLALKHGIRVRLRPQESGLTAMVLLPEDLLAALPGASPAAPAQASPFDLASRSFPSFPAFPEARPAAGPDQGRARPLAPSALSAPLPAGVTAVPPQTRPSGPDVWSPPARTGPPGPSESPGPSDPSGLPGSPGEFPSPPRTGLPGGFPPPSPGPLDPLGASSPAAGDGPLPGTGTSPLDAGDEYLPIFASVESGWFRTGTLEPLRRTGLANGEPASAGEPGGEPLPAAPGQDWSSPADSGWQAARVVSEPAHGGLTTSGLPKRTPKANLVPGSVSASPAQAPAGLRPQSPPYSSGPRSQPPAQPARPAAPLSAERVRDRMASFQQGVRRARNELPNRES